jgi:hypothetical protein
MNHPITAQTISETGGRMSVCSHRNKCLALPAVLVALFAVGAVSATSVLAAQTGGEAPSVAGVSVSNVTEHNATLEAQIDPNGLQTTYQFELGKMCYPAFCDYILEIPLPVESLSSAQGNQFVSLDLNSVGVKLLPNSRYDYSILATNSAGETRSEAHNMGGVFMTPAEGTTSGPVSETGSASNLSQTSVTLSGNVNPRGAVETTYAFEYGTTISYGASAPTPPEVIRYGGCGIPCEITTPQPISVSVTGLEPGATYHYRLISNSAQGTSYGQDAIFTTTPLANESETPSNAGSNQPSSSPMVATVTPVAIPTAPIVAPVTMESKVTDNALKLNKVLRACAGKSKKQRAKSKCEHQARDKYAAAANKTDKKTGS